MRWDGDGNVYVVHEREYFNCAPDQVIVHCSYDQVKGTWAGFNAEEKARSRSDYDAAKFGFDMGAAFDIIDRCRSDDADDRLIDYVEHANHPLRLVFPHPSFDDEDLAPLEGGLVQGPRNALPFAFSDYLARTLGAEKDNEIIESARVGRTSLKKWLRFLCQPSFEGRVRPNRSYIIVDDVVTTCGTLAALYSYIVRNGADVVGTVSLAHKEGKSHRFGIAPDTHDMLISRYGVDFRDFWRRTIGHDSLCLTEAEGRYLVDWAKQVQRWGVGSGSPLLQRLRERLNKAAATGR